VAGQPEPDQQKKKKEKLEYGKRQLKRGIERIGKMEVRKRDDDRELRVTTLFLHSLHDDIK
jgi:hypothetical protein